jgi:hypothetical protein
VGYIQQAVEAGKAKAKQNVDKTETK